MEKEMRQQEAIKMMKWIAEYPQIVNQIADVEHCITPVECIETIDLLEKYGFEYLVPILLHAIDYNYKLDRAISKFRAEVLATVWEQRGTAHILDEIKCIIREEIKRTELRESARSEKEE